MPSRQPSPAETLLQLPDAIQRLRKRDIADPEVRSALTDALQELASAQLMAGQLPEAKGNLLEALELLHSHGRPGDRSAMAQRAGIQIKLGYVFCSLEDGATALSHFAQAIDYFRDQPDDQRAVIAALNGQATAHGLMNSQDRAIECLEQAQGIAERIAKVSQSAMDAEQWAMLLNNLGRAQLAVGDFPSATTAMMRCVGITQELRRFEDSHARRNLHAAVTCRLGNVHEAAGRLAEARACYRESVGDMRHLVEELGLRQFAHDYAHAVKCLQRLEGSSALAEAGKA